MVSLPVATLIMVIFAEEHVFVSTVSCEGYRRDAQTWKASLEAVPPGEWSCVPPLFSAQSQHPHSAYCLVTHQEKWYCEDWLTLLPMGLLLEYPLTL